MRRYGVDDAWAALESMQQQGVRTDRFTVSRMLMRTVGDGDGRTRQNPARVYAGISLVERFIQLQPEEADEVLFNALLDTCCRMKDVGRLEVTMQRMLDLNVPPSHVTLGILVKAYGQAGDLERVLSVWDEMAEQRRQANAVTYGCMIDACVKCGHLAKALDIFEDMKKKKKHRNTILYTTLIKGHGLDKDLPQAYKLFREMSAENVPYNTITYNSIIDVCIKCENVTLAEELLREMMAPGSNLEPDLITYSTLLKGYCHIGDLDKALKVAETIKTCGLKCDELVYNTLMDGCVKANDLSAGIGLFAEMAEGGMRPSSITHSILVRLHQRNSFKGDAVDAVAKLYQHHGLERPQGSSDRVKGSRSGRRGDKQRKQPGGAGGHRGGESGGDQRHQRQAHKELHNSCQADVPKGMSCLSSMPQDQQRHLVQPMLHGHDGSGGPCRDAGMDSSVAPQVAAAGASPLLLPNTLPYMHFDAMRNPWPYGLQTMPMVDAGNPALTMNGMPGNPSGVAGLDFDQASLMYTLMQQQQLQQQQLHQLQQQQLLQHTQQLLQQMTQVQGRGFQLNPGLTMQNALPSALPYNFTCNSNPLMAGSSGLALPQGWPLADAAGLKEAG